MHAQPEDSEREFAMLPGNLGNKHFIIPSVWGHKVRLARLPLSLIRRTRRTGRRRNGFGRGQCVHRGKGHRVPRKFVRRVRVRQNCTLLDLASEVRVLLLFVRLSVLSGRPLARRGLVGGREELGKEGFVDFDVLVEENDEDDELDLCVVVLLRTYERGGPTRTSRPLGEARKSRVVCRAISVASRTG